MVDKLMFQVGVDWANQQYKQIYDEVMKLAELGKKPIELEVKFKTSNDLKIFVDSLKAIGDGKLLEPLLQKIEQLQTSMVRLGVIPKDINYSALEQQLSKVTEAYNKYAEARAKAKLKGMPGEKGASEDTAYTFALRKTYNNLSDSIQRDFNVSEKVARALVETYNNMGKTIASNMERIGGSKAGMETLAGEVTGVKNTVDQLVNSFSNLVRELTKLGSGNTTGLKETEQVLSGVDKETRQMANALSTALKKLADQKTAAATGEKDLDTQTQSTTAHLRAEQEQAMATAEALNQLTNHLTVAAIASKNLFTVMGGNNSDVTKFLELATQMDALSRKASFILGSDGTSFKGGKMGAFAEVKKEMDDVATKMADLQKTASVGNPLVESFANAFKMLEETLTKANTAMSNAASSAKKLENSVGGSKGGVENLNSKFKSEDIQKLISAITTLNDAAKSLKQTLSSLSKNTGKDGLKKVAESTQAASEAVQKLKSVEQTSTQGGIFDPQKFTNLQEAIDKIISEVNRLQEAFARLGENNSLSNLTQLIRNLEATMGSLSNAFKFTANTEELAAYEAKVKSLQQTIEKLEAKAKGLNATIENSGAGIKTQAEKKGSESMLADNLQKLSTAIRTAKEEYDRLNESYGQAKTMGMPMNDAIEKRLALLGQLILTMQNLKEAANQAGSAEAEALSKSKAFSFIQANGNQLFSKENNQLYNKREIDGLIKTIEQFIKTNGEMAQTTGSARTGLQQMSEAMRESAERANQAGFSFANTVAGMRNFAMNIETARAAYDKTLRGISDLENRISAGQKANMDQASLEFMEGLKMRAQQWANVLKEILGNDMKGNSVYKEWLSMSGNMLTSPQVGNLFQSLLGSDWKILLKDIGSTFNMLTKFSGFNKELTLDNTQIKNIEKGEEAVRRLDNALKDLNRQWADTNQNAKTPDLTAKYEAQKQAIESLRAQIKGAMTDEAQMANRNGLVGLLGVGYKNAAGYDNTRLMQEMKAASKEAEQAEKERGQTTEASVDKTKQSYNSAKESIEQFTNLLKDAKRYLDDVSGKGFNTDRLERFYNGLLNILHVIEQIKANGGVHPTTAQTTSQVLSEDATSKRITNLRTELNHLKQIGNEVERIEKLQGSLSALSMKVIDPAQKQLIQDTIHDLTDMKGMLLRSSSSDSLTLMASKNYQETLAGANNLLKENTQQVKDNDRAMKDSVDSTTRAGRAISDLQKQYERFRGSKSYAKARDLGIDTTEYQRALETLQRYQRVLQYIKDSGGSHDASLITGSVGYKEMQNNLEIQLRLLRKKVQDTEKANAANNELSASEQRLANALKQSTDSMKNQSQILGDLKMMAYQYLSVWGAQNFVHNIIDIGGQLENQRRSITAILGEAAWANDLFSKIQTQALKSPFGVVQLDQYTKQLAAYNFQYNELFEWTNRLADISAGTGTDFSRLTLALGHVRSEMALTGYTLRQFAMGNVPLLQKLSENLGKTTSEIRKMVREKKISYDDVKKVLEDLTNEGGMFYNMQEVISESVKSRWKNLGDAIDIMYGQMAEGAPGTVLKETAVLLTNVAKQWRVILPIFASVASIWGIMKLSMLAYNRGVKANIAATLSQSVSFKNATAAEIDKMVVSKALTKQELLQAVATRKLTVDQAELAAATFNVNRAQLQQLRSSRALIGASMGLGKLANPYTAALVAAEAVFGVYQAYSSWVEDISNRVEGMIETSKTGLKELKKYVDSMGEAPTNEVDMKGESEEMKTVLKNAGLWTEEMEEQVGLTEDLKTEYNTLVDIMHNGVTELQNMRYEAELLKEILKSSSTDIGWLDWVESIEGVINPVFGVLDTFFNKASGRNGGTVGVWNFFFNDDILKNAEQFEQSAGKFKAFFNGISEMHDDLQDVMNQEIRLQEFNPFMKGLEGLTLEEQLLKLSQSSYWDDFVERAKVANADFGRVAEEMKDRLDDVNDDFQEIVEDDIPKMLDKWMKEFGLEGKDFQEWAKKHPEQAEQMISNLEKLLDEKGPIIAQKIRAMLLPNGLVGSNGQQIINPIMQGLTVLGQHKKTPLEEQAEREKAAQIEISNANKKIGDTAKKNLPELQKLNKGITSIWLSKYFNVEDVTGNEKRVTDEIKKLKSNIKTKKKQGYDTTEDKEELARLQAVKKYYGFTDKEDERNAKKDPWVDKIKKRLSVIKEAASAYRYWRDKVGGGAWARVKDEFGDVLDNLGINEVNLKNIQAYLGKLMVQTGLIKDTDKRNNAQKDILKEEAQESRNEFERESKDYVSILKVELDDLARQWDIFNSVASSTGDRALASRLSGISPGATPADLKRLKVSQFAGKTIDYDKVINMSDREIDEYVTTLGLAEDKIEAIRDGLKDWKKAQQDVTKSDIQNYAKWLGSLVDLQSIRNRNQEEYNRILEETNRLQNGGMITPEEAERRRQNATLDQWQKNWQADSMYSRLYNNAQSMGKNEFAMAYRTEMFYLNEGLKKGTITTEQYADKVDKLNGIMREFELDGFLGIKGDVGAFISGGYQGMIDNKRNKAKDLRKQGKMDEAKELDDQALSMEKAQHAAEQVAKAFQDLSTGADMLSNMFDALGMEGAANGFGDAAGVLGGVASGAQSLSGLGPWGMAAGAAIGGITSLAQLHDKSNQRVIEALQRNVKALEANTEVIKKFRERTLGYDNGALRRQILINYKASGAAGGAMKEFYGQNSQGNGYSQELANLQKMREDYIGMYNAEDDKKKSSSEALLEYKQKIAELDDQIMHFTQDLAKELWSIDIKGWADQIGDALWTAFENGEDAAEAFRDTAKDIVSDVAKNMWKLSILEPAFKELQDKLFGKNNVKNGAIKYDANGNIDMQASEPEVLRILGEFFGEGGTLEKQIDAGEIFYDWVKQVTGIDLDKDDSSTSSKVIQGGFTENETGLLLSYVNGIRGDVSVNRALLAQYLPSLYSAMTAYSTQLGNIEKYTSAIKDSNASILSAVDKIESHISGLKNVNWKVPVK